MENQRISIPRPGKRPPEQKRPNGNLLLFAEKLVYCTPLRPVPHRMER